jgi:hypothetical protein
MKTLIVREGFTLGANDYPRGAEITDPAIIAMVKDSHPGHVHDSQADVDETPAPQLPKGKGRAAPDTSAP